MQKGFGKHISLASVLAFAVASGTAVAAGEQGAHKDKQAQAGETDVVTSTDQMQQLAKQGKEVPEGKLDPEEVAEASGEESADGEGDDVAAAETEDTASAATDAEDGAEAPESPLPPPDEAVRHPTAPANPAIRGDAAEGEGQGQQDSAQGAGSAHGAAAEQDTGSAQGAGAAQGSGAEQDPGSAQGAGAAQGAGTGQDQQQLNPVNQAMVDPTIMNATPKSLMGREVADSQGQTLGKITNVVRNPQTQEIRVLVQPDQAEGQQGGQQVIALKPDQLKMENGDKIRLSKQMSQQELQQSGYQPSQYQPLDRNRTLGFDFKVPPSTAGAQEQQELGELNVEYGDGDATAQEQEAGLQTQDQAAAEGDTAGSDSAVSGDDVEADAQATEETAEAGEDRG